MHVDVTGWLVSKREALFVSVAHPFHAYSFSHRQSLSPSTIFLILHFLGIWHVFGNASFTRIPPYSHVRVFYLFVCFVNLKQASHLRRRNFSQDDASLRLFSSLLVDMGRPSYCGRRLPRDSGSECYKKVG